tara:strand:+ start:3605 stop:4507 length:903 start_codon:yes stop_codon:yes gene_type:complete
MFYTVNLGSLIKVFQSDIKYSVKDIIEQHTSIYQKEFIKDDIIEYNHIPVELIKDNYLYFENNEKMLEKLDMLTQLSDIYKYFNIATNLTSIKKNTNISAYQPNDNICTVDNVNELILDENKTILDLLFNPNTMKVYYKDKYKINQNQINMKMFPELSYIGEFIFNMNIDDLKVKLLNKYYYSVDQVKIVVNTLTLDDSEVLTYQKLIELFHQKFEFEEKLSYNLEEIVDNLSTNSDINVLKFYQMCLKDFLETNKVKMEDNKYLLNFKVHFKEISMDKPISTEEFNNLLQEQIKEREDN